MCYQTCSVVYIANKICISYLILSNVGVGECIQQPSISLRLRRNGRYNAEDIFKCIFLKENVWIPTKILLKFVPKGPINNILALVQIMAWHRPGDKPLSEPMMVCLLMHICITRPQWVNISHTLVGNKIVDHLDIVGALPVGSAPTTSSFST